MWEVNIIPFTETKRPKMIKTLIVAGIIYIGLLVLFTKLTRTRDKTTGDYFLAGSNIGSFLGLFTFAATLFSTFTILGMPDFFRQHGIGAWIFLAFSDAVMVFGIMFLGYYFRKKAKRVQYFGMAGFMRDQYQSKLAGIVAFFGAFVFLIPYVAIQIRGVAIFLNEAFPGSFPLWIWGTGIVLIMLMYSEIGGLKAIIYSDTLQGILLLVVIWIIGITCLNQMGGIQSMFEQVENKDSSLLSVPGPKGLFNFQFLIGSMIAITLIPFTQPQVSTRIMIMKDQKSLFRMAIGLGVFAILVILPTMFIGLYGALHYADVSTSEFLGNTLLEDQNGFLAAMVLIGLVAAAISTADSQIFALGGETRSLLTGEDKKMISIARVSIVVFALLSLVFALFSTDELVLLARTSFAGTALLAPMIFVGLFHTDSTKCRHMPIVTFVAIVVLILSQLGVLGSMVLGIRMDLFLLGLLAVVGLLSFWLSARSHLSLLILAGATLLGGCQDTGETKGKRPNIVIIMCDDMGYSDIGCYGGEIQTPNLDQLAANGLRFTHFYNNAKCSPTRASLLTGIYPQVTSHGDNTDTMKNAITIAEVLRQAGYSTYMSGKWHNGELPVDRGFDRYYGLVDGCSNFFNPGEQRPGEPSPGKKWKRARKWAIDDEVFEPFTPQESDFYTTDAFTSNAIQYIREHDSESPFLLYLAYTAPHYPLHAPPEDVAKYKGRYMAGWDSLRVNRLEKMKDLGILDADLVLDENAVELNPFLNSLKEGEWVSRYWDDQFNLMSWEEIADKEKWDLKMAVYAAMIDRMDQNIGRLVDELKNNGQFNNTLIMFLSDNGACAETIHLDTAGSQMVTYEPGMLGSYHTVDLPWAWLSNTPYRMFKSWLHEGGMISPFIVHWPDRIKNRGAIMREPGHVMDFMATCIELAGAEYPGKNPKGEELFPMQGESLLPLFEGHQRSDSVMVWQYGAHRVVRMGHWKALKTLHLNWELYDLKVDAVEQNNLAKQYPQLIARADSIYRNWLTLTSFNQRRSDSLFVERLNRFLTSNSNTTGIKNQFPDFFNFETAL